MDRAKTAEIASPPGGIVPENLVRDLRQFAAWEPSDSPRAEAMLRAADVLSTLPVKQTDSQRIKNDAFAIRGYRIDTSVEAKCMRIVYFHEKGNQGVSGVLELQSNNAYEFAHDILKRYDEVEGIR